jgi:hypothetical protein
METIMMLKRFVFTAAAAASLFLLATAPASAQAYPAQPAALSAGPTLSQAELQQLFSREIRFAATATDNRNNAESVRTFRPNGTVHNEFNGFGTDGTYQVSGNRLCQSFPMWKNGAWFCLTLRATGAGSYDAINTETNVVAFTFRRS